MLITDNCRSKSPTKVKTKRKLQQFTVSGWLIMNRGGGGGGGGRVTVKKEKCKTKITFNMHNNETLKCK